MSNTITSNYLHFTVADERRMLYAQALQGDDVLLGVAINGGGATFELTADQARQLGQWLMSHTEAD